MAADNLFSGWAIVELMGHVRIAGKVTEEEHFGAKLGRIDIPGKVPCQPCGGTGGYNDTRDCGECRGSGEVDGFTTQYFGGASVYRVTPTTEEIARAVAKSNQVEPVYLWDLRRQLEGPKEVEKEDDFDAEGVRAGTDF